MKTLTVNLPSIVGSGEKQLLLMRSPELHEKDKLPLGQATELSACSKRAFIKVLENYGVSVLNYTGDDLEGDVENVKTLHI